MPNKKITQLSSAEATVAAIFPVVVSGANQQLGLRDILAGLGIPQYVEGTCRATATVAFLPGPVNIFDMYVKALAGSSAAVGGSEVEIGIGTNSTYYAGAIPTSGKQLVRVGASEFSDINRLQLTSGAIVACAPTATANASFVVGIGYFRV